MRYIKWGFILIVLAVVAGGLHWSLPSRDIVRITGTDVVRITESGGVAKGETQGTRDLRLINTVTPEGDVQVYRNEDTGWGWPPYFKFDSANLAAAAAEFASTSDNPRWVVLTHYGWRITFLSKFPNTLSIRLAEGPDETLIPWFNIVVVTLLIVVALVIRHRILRFFGA